MNCDLRSLNPLERPRWPRPLLIPPLTGALLVLLLFQFSTAASLTSERLSGILIGGLVTEKVGSLTVESRTVACLSLKLSGLDTDELNGKGYMGAMELSKDQVVRSDEIRCSFGEKEEGVGNLRFSENLSLPFRILGPLPVSGTFEGETLKLEVGEEFSLVLSPREDFFEGFFRGRLQGNPQISPSSREETESELQSVQDESKKEVETDKKERERSNQEGESEKAKRGASSATEEGSSAQQEPSTKKEEEGDNIDDGEESRKDKTGPAQAAEELNKFARKSDGKPNINITKGDGIAFFWYSEKPPK